MKLTKEDIQAIAQELRKSDAISDTNAQARAQSQNVRKNEGQKPKKIEGIKTGINVKNVATMGLIVFWGVVFVLLLIKIMPYI